MQLYETVQKVRETLAVAANVVVALSLCWLTYVAVYALVYAPLLGPVTPRLSWFGYVHLFEQSHNHYKMDVKT